MVEQLVETWRIHDRIHRYLLDTIDEKAMGAVITPKLRSVSALFAHIHNVRLMWLKSASPELLKGLDKLEADAAKAQIAKALEKSGDAIATLIQNSAVTGKVKGFKPHLAAFIGYLISHESHHRGQIGWTLKATGNALDQKTAYGLWEWGVR